MRSDLSGTCHRGVNLRGDNYEARRMVTRKRTVLHSTKILVVPDDVALPSDVRSGEASTTQNLYLESLIELLVRRLDHIVVRENCEAYTSKSMRM
jgi:hypothetical protein